MTLNLSTVEDLAKALKEARAKNRQIVPIVGAGLSADCGFPVIVAVVRYFGKLYQYIENRGSVKKSLQIDFVNRLFKTYESEPWRFVDDFGWPDRFQLNQDLFTQINADATASREDLNQIENAVRESLVKMLQQVNPQGSWALKELTKDIETILGTESEASPKIKARLTANGTKSTAFDLFGDWRRLILYFTNFQSDYADALFARFGATRRPGQGHQFLTFLAKHLACPTIFTFNFDSLIEQALEAENVRIRVFAMERGAGLPHASLLRGDQVSVIKMHGSTHALLLDEQLDRPLSPDYLNRFDRITQANPLLLVVGCSDNDRRLRDIVSRVAGKSASADDGRKEIKGHPDGSERSPSVLWLYYEDEPPKSLDTFASSKLDVSPRVLVCPTNNPGATLLHLHSWLSNCNPAGRVPYLTHVEQPVHLRNGSKKARSKARFRLITSNGQENPMPTAASVLLETANSWARKGYHFIWVDLEAVHTLAGVVGSIIDQCRKFDPDLAPSVLPLDIDHLNNEEDRDFVKSVIRLAAKRVARALRRTRYYVAFDGLETFAYPATTHHGLTHIASNKGAAQRFQQLLDFLVELTKLKRSQSLGESRIGVSIDNPKCRYEGSPLELCLPDYVSVAQVHEALTPAYSIQKVKAANKNGYQFDSTFVDLSENFPLVTLKSIKPVVSEILRHEDSCEPDQLGECRSCRTRIALVLLNLSFFRRTRPMVAMRHLLEPLLPSPHIPGSDPVGKSHIDELLVQFSKGTKRKNEPRPSRTNHAEKQPKYEILRQLEGGGFWFNHTIRDYLYAQNTRFTNTQHLKKCLDDKGDMRERVADCRAAAFQLFLTDTIHQRIARTWYTRTFVQSHDTFAFLEYTYHQISSIRSLVKLRGLAQIGQQCEGIAEAVQEGIAKCGALVDIININKDAKSSRARCDIFRQLEFEGERDFRKKFFEQLADATSVNGRTERKKLTRIEHIEKLLKERHKRELHDLYRAWTRAEVILRTQVAAEQLLHWCDELLEDDLEHRCNRVVIKYKRSAASAPYKAVYCQSFPEEHLIDRDIDDELIAKFRRYLEDLRVKLWIERSDYKTCIAGRRKQLARKLKVPLQECEKAIQKWDALDCHQLLDINDSWLKLKQERSLNDGQLKKGRNRVLKNLESIEKALKRIKKSVEKKARQDPAADYPQALANLNEAWLRMLHLRAESQLGRVTMFSHDGFTGDPDNWVPRTVELEKAIDTINKGLEGIKARDARTRYTPRSVVVDPTADGTLYLQYRSVFYLLNGRVRWLEKRDSAPKAFEAALWSFEMARGGLGEHGPLISALIELYTVEALLARNRTVLHPKQRQNSSDWGSDDPIKLAVSWYRSAQGGLQRANELLLRGRRNVIWRKFYFRLLTQYHADRLLANYASLERMKQEKSRSLNNRRKADEKEYEKHWREKSRKSLIGLRRGYQSLLTALDLYLPLRETEEEESRRSGENSANRFRWLFRMWHELTLCGYAIGRLTLDVLGQKESSSHDEYVREQLKWLNEMDGIDGSELGQLIKDHHYGSLVEEFKALRAIRSADATDVGLKRRQRIITRASKLSRMVKN